MMEMEIDNPILFSFGFHFMAWVKFIMMRWKMKDDIWIFKFAVA